MEWESDLYDFSDPEVRLEYVPINCREAGFNCDYIVKGETEEEVMKNGVEHAKGAHGLKEETENNRTYSDFLTFFTLIK